MAIVESRYSELIDKITVGLRAYLFAIIILLSSLSSFADPAYNVFFKNEPIKGYNRIRSGIVDELSGVPPKSLIISLWETEYVFLHFTRPDLLYMSLPSEKLKQGLLDKSNEVYIYADWSRLSDNENVTSFFEQFVPTGMQTSKKLMRIK
ncbi:hypothetical protein AGMMS49940_11840 [Spirochaetia bacterium]|nr:hypothetical protein AGMMS49940_11840 [Spirochaetia bacterium]